MSNLQCLRHWRFAAPLLARSELLSDQPFDNALPALLVARDSALRRSQYRLRIKVRTMEQVASEGGRMPITSAVCLIRLFVA